MLEFEVPWPMTDRAVVAVRMPSSLNDDIMLLVRWVVLVSRSSAGEVKKCDVFACLPDQHSNSALFTRIESTFITFGIFLNSSFMKAITTIITSQHHARGRSGVRPVVPT